MNSAELWPRLGKAGENVCICAVWDDCRDAGLTGADGVAWRRCMQNWETGDDGPPLIAATGGGFTRNSIPRPNADMNNPNDSVMSANTLAVSFAAAL